jgi:hypothetical protein
MEKKDGKRKDLIWLVDFENINLETIEVLKKVANAQNTEI